jgi:hypothetical protein
MKAAGNERNRSTAFQEMAPYFEGLGFADRFGIQGRKGNERKE